MNHLRIKLFIKMIAMFESKLVFRIRFIAKNEKVYVQFIYLIYCKIITENEIKAISSEQTGRRKTIYHRILSQRLHLR